MLRWGWAMAVCLSLGLGAAAVEPPAPVPPIPTERQLAWHALEYYGFIHFTLNTFTDMEWGMGDESPATFAPTDLDPRQWVTVAEAAGMTGLILTCKHHDGFCLWPSEHTEHSVAQAPVSRDVVGETAAACAEMGLRFGVYLSPWDRNHAEYGRPAYIPYYRAQLQELLTQYGDVFTVWLDGANGGTGYYGGAREERTIDRTTYYDWETTWSLIREWAPNAMIFSDVGPDVRWVGNESGYAGDPCWHTYTPRSSLGDAAPPAPGQVMYKEGQEGHIDGQYWMPAEVDVSIRPGWFWHERENEKVRTPENLMQIYYESVGRGTTLLLNVPPDRRGLLHENDVAALMGFKALRDKAFALDVARDAHASATNVRGEAAAFDAGNAIDGDRTTYWATDDGVTTGTITVTLSAPAMVDHVVLQEYIELGQRIRKYSVEAQVDGAWKPIAEGESIGWKRIHAIDPITTDAVRVHILDAKACPTLSTVSLFGAVK